MSTVDPQEINAFTAQASQWWDEQGPFKPLHKINPLRLTFLRDEMIAHFKLSNDKTRENCPPLEGLKILDVGCGGGLLCEPLTRLGATVTGIDAGQENIDIALEHAKSSGLTIDYRCTTSEDLAATGAQFDCVTALEIVEHVADVPLFIKSCSDLVRPKGQLFMSTLNRTLKSYALGIIAAEYILRWVPKGTHQWSKFLEPAELNDFLEKNGVALQSLKGLTLDPFTNSWNLSNDLDVNYLLSAVKR
jgi:2-polyprenyl-6-hydroxyphenyl methylase/3-demethylubiquinone-9 3-methyltransferase